MLNSTRFYFHIELLAPKPYAKIITYQAVSYDIPYGVSTKIS
jgi:hypothetical protein